MEEHDAPSHNNGWVQIVSQRGVGFHGFPPIHEEMVVPVLNSCSKVMNATTTTYPEAISPAGCQHAKDDICRLSIISIGISTITLGTQISSFQVLYVK